MLKKREDCLMQMRGIQKIRRIVNEFLAHRKNNLTAVSKNLGKYSPENNITLDHQNIYVGC